jgi:hypothetical protein
VVCSRIGTRNREKESTMAGWLDRKARKRYARSYRDIRAVRNDVRGIASHLRDSLPSIFEYDGQAGYTGWPSSITPAKLLSDPVDVPLTPYEEVITNTAKLDGMVFWFTDKNVEGGGSKRFAIVIVEEPAGELGDDADGDVDPPAFTTEAPPPLVLVPATDPGDPEDADEDPEAECDCNE